MSLLTLGFASVAMCVTLSLLNTHASLSQKIARSLAVLLLATVCLSALYGLGIIRFEGRFGV